MVVGFGVPRRCRRRDELVVALVATPFLFGARRQLLGRRRIPLVIVVVVVVVVVVANQLAPHLIRIICNRTLIVSQLLLHCHHRPSTSTLDQSTPSNQSDQSLIIQSIVMVIIFSMISLNQSFMMN